MSEQMMLERTNNLDALRLLAAAAVIVGHGFQARGDLSAVPFVLGYPIHHFGVVVFFSISGYLIAASWRRTPSWRAYLMARSLRIFPALVALVLICVVLVGPVFNQLSVGDYVAAAGTWAHLGNLVLYVQPTLPGVFPDLPNPTLINGSLWTLPVEFACYLALPALLMLPRRAAVPAVLAGTAAVLAWMSWSGAADGAVLYATPVGEAAKMAAFFAAGALLRILQESRPRLFRLPWAFAALGVHLAVMVLAGDALALLSWLTLPYGVLTVGLASAPVLRRAARFGDLSYGVYLWGFPVQQALLQLWWPASMWVNLALVMLGSAALAWCSWHLIERPALALKHRPLVSPDSAGRIAERAVS